MPKRRRPRGVTPHPRSGAAAKSARLRRRRNSREELPHVRGQGQWPGGATPCPRLGAAAERSYLASQVRGSGREEQPHLQGAVGVQVQEGLEELSNGRAVVRRYPSSKVRSGGCALLEQL